MSCIKYFSHNNIAAAGLFRPTVHPGAMITFGNKIGTYASSIHVIDHKMLFVEP